MIETDLTLLISLSAGSEGEIKLPTFSLYLLSVDREETIEFIKANR